VLCPLWGTSGQVLRADAAASFNALSRKYAETFSAPICVTDSYRDFASQVAVRAAKPTLAAVPGTSNHGWGVALDLCDGVQVFGSPQHEWLKLHAMAYGWFHPSWAQAGGSKPEPWHWSTRLAARGARPRQQPAQASGQHVPLPLPLQSTPGPPAPSAQRGRGRAEVRDAS
jgi:hypothetical protein